MQAKTFYSFIGFGTRHSWLNSAKPGVSYSMLKKRLDVYFKNLETFGLPVTSRAADGLRRLRQEIDIGDPEAPVSEEHRTELIKEMRAVDLTFQAEAKGKFAYTVTEKRVDVEKLLDNVSALLRPGIYARLPQVAQYDLAEAGKCIAFDRPTAAAFHLLRGTEDVLRSFYCSKVRNKRVRPLLWGPMVAHLRSRRKAAPRELLDTLDNIRINYRNPTQHPDKRYDIEEVQDLVGLCVDVINRMGSSLVLDFESAIQ